MNLKRTIFYENINYTSLTLISLCLETIVTDSNSSVNFILTEVNTNDKTEQSL